MEDIDFAVRYPFSSTAKRTLESRGTQLNDSIVLLGCDRIRNALRGGAGKSTALHDEDKVSEIASFAAARMMLSYLRNSFITNKFAVAESKRVSGYLDKEDEQVLWQVGGELGFVAQKEGNTLLVPIPTYLKFSPRALPYKLINRELRGGTVVVATREFVRLMEEAVRKRLEKNQVLRDPPPMIVDAAKKLIAELPKSDLPQVKVKPGDYPPCVMKLLDNVKKHENLNHQARFYLCVYLMAAGMSDDELVSLYSNLPDFSERITKYQVEHARKKGYTCPACVTVTTWGFCCADCRIGSPLNWQGRKGWKG
jgi:DNA primase large subunit